MTGPGPVGSDFGHLRPQVETVASDVELEADRTIGTSQRRHLQLEAKVVERHNIARDTGGYRELPARLYRRRLLPHDRHPRRCQDGGPARRYQQRHNSGRHAADERRIGRRIQASEIDTDFVDEGPLDFDEARFDIDLRAGM
jgi:hypothetical protein